MYINPMKRNKDSVCNSRDNSLFIDNFAPTISQNQLHLRLAFFVVAHAFVYEWDAQAQHRSVVSPPVFFVRLLSIWQVIEATFLNR